MSLSVSLLMSPMICWKKVLSHSYSAGRRMATPRMWVGLNYLSDSTISRKRIMTSRSIVVQSTH
jgi:hypothetical protein